MCGMVGDLADTATFAFKVDGYAVGDRLLEGVDFDVVVAGDPGVSLEIVSLSVSSSAQRYFETLNAQYWLDAVRDHLVDVFDEFVGTPDAAEIMADAVDTGYLMY